MPSGGLLFSDYFLRSGVEDLPEWNAQQPQDLAHALEQIVEVVRRAQATAHANESVTEQLVVEPVLRLLGWSEWLRQQTLSPTGRTDVPDYLLFRDDRTRQQALGLAQEHRRYGLGTTFLEAKKWEVPLDRAAGATAPSTQMLRYLSLAEVQSDQQIRFAVLTNGRLWRLYDQKARSRAEEFLEIDLALIVSQDLITDPEEASGLFGYSCCFSPVVPSSEMNMAERCTSGHLARAAGTRSGSPIGSPIQSSSEYFENSPTRSGAMTRTVRPMPAILPSFAKRR